MQINKLISIGLFIILIAVLSNYVWKKPANEEFSVDQHPEQNIPAKQTEESAESSVEENYQPPVIARPAAPVAEKLPPQAAVQKSVEPLPDLNASDEYIAMALGKLTDMANRLFSFKSFIRHFVVTIDNMTNKKIPQRYAFTKKPPGKFMVSEPEADLLLLDPRNYQRYKHFIYLAETLNTKALTAFYFKSYPLFQQAYAELGYTDQLFNDRFIFVINHLLQTPDVHDPIKLVRPKVFYQFADPDLESRSAGQKIILRIGYDNAQRVKAKLLDLRTALIEFMPER